MIYGLKCMEIPQPRKKKTAQKTDLLNKQLDKQKDVVSETFGAYQKMIEAYGFADERSKALQKSINAGKNRL